MKHRTRRFVASFISLGLLLPSFALAAAAQDFSDGPYEPFMPMPGDAPPAEETSEFKSCFDYYRFGSTPVVLGSELSRVAQGATVAFTGKITNENAYPVSDLALYVKMFHRRNPALKDSFGPDVVDWFLVRDGINLNAGEVMPVGFTWKVPIDATPGQYAAATFVVSHDRFNMSGLSFTNDIVGSSYEFNVDGGNLGNTQFDITKTMADQEVVHAAAYSPRVENDDLTIPITAVLANTSGNNFNGTVRWKLYAWDTNLEANFIESKEVPVSVGARDSATLQYQIPKSEASVFNLVGELVPANPAQAKSFVAVRLVSGGAAVPRLNFVGASAYPATVGTEVFACMHSTGLSAAKNGRVEVTARSMSFIDMLTGKGVLASKTFEGTIPGNIVALAVPMDRVVEQFSVSAKLYQDGQLVDSVEVPYGCKGSSCGGIVSIQVLITQIIVVLVLILGAVKILRTRTNTQVPPPAAMPPKV